MINLIATADLHIRSDSPPCRTDDFRAVQKNTLETLVQKSRENNAPLVIAGDIFHTARVPQWLESEVLSILSGTEVYAVMGNHDLNYNNQDYLPRTSLGVLVASGVVKLLPARKNGVSIGALHSDASWKEWPEKADVVVAHQFVYQTEPPFPGAEKLGRQGKKIGRFWNSDASVLISGDNHQSFYVTKNGKLLINPGAVTRQKSDAKEHVPKAFLIRGEEEPQLTEIELPDNDPEAVSREHLEKTEERDERLKQLAERLHTPTSVTVSFRSNMEETLQNNRLRKNVKRKIQDKLNEHTEVAE